MSRRAFLLAAAMAFVALRLAGQQQGSSGSAEEDGGPDLKVSADVVVSAKKPPSNLAEVTDASESLVGLADAASQGVVGARQLDLRPVQRTGEILESVPGLVVSQHSGEGKANQYYLRGFNLDHGTDFATAIGGVPVNMPSHAHGQGYSDVNFVIPELIGAIQYGKGTYSAEQGDFSAAGSADIRLVDELPRGIAQAGGGEDGFGRLLVADSPRVGGGRLLYAFETTRYDGPWVHPDDSRRYNGLLRYSFHGDDSAWSVTAMGYQSRWNSTDQVPGRALSEGLVSPYGAIDPTDGGETHRYSLSVDGRWNGADSVTRATAYAVDYGLDLFSNFTYFLDDPLRGDQFEQVDRRVVTGAKGSREWRSSWFGRETRNAAGIEVRHDNIAENGLFHTEARRVLDTVSVDHVTQTSASVWFENSVRWSEKLRTVVGLREDVYRFGVRSDNPANSGDDSASLLSPKFSAVLGPWLDTELYANLGYGFHSNDARGSTITVDPKTGDPVSGVTPLARAKGAEIGVRSVLVPHLQATVSVWGLDLASELVFLGDAGTTEASRPSRRQGVEVASFWSPLPWLTLDADLAFSKARFRDPDPPGDHVPGAVETVVAAGAAVEDLAGFFGSVRLRYFGPRPLVEDDSVRSKSSTLVNLQVGHQIVRGVRLALDVFNVLDAKVSDIDYYYASRLPGEPAGGVTDIHTHPAIPRSARLSVLYSFQ